jgi:L-rhamnose isomerase
MVNNQSIQKAYDLAKERYAALGVDTDAALKQLQAISISLHCWQADDVTGFENPDATLSGGIQATGNYPGKARNIEELRADILKAASLIPANTASSACHLWRFRWGLCRPRPNRTQAL